MKTLTQHTYISTSVEQTQAYARFLAASLKPNDVIMLTGDLGAGKTHFTQGLAQALGIMREVTSPTFTLMSVYEAGALPLYHFDLYRLEDPLELEDIGFYEALESEGVSCIEWGDKFPDDMPDDLLTIDITVNLQGERSLCVSATGPRSSELLNCWKEQLNVYE